MGKQIVGTDIGSYAFNASAKTITLTGLNTLTLGQILLVTNVTAGVVIYQFNNHTKGGSISGNVITLTFDTSGQQNTDKLQIIIDYPELLKSVQFASVRASSSGANIIVTGVATKKIKLLSYTLVTDSAVSLKWQSNSTDLSGAMSLVANGGISTPIGTRNGGWLMETAVGETLNLNLSGAFGVSGHISYFLEE